MPRTRLTIGTSRSEKFWWIEVSSIPNVIARHEAATHEHEFGENFVDIHITRATLRYRGWSLRIVTIHEEELPSIGVRVDSIGGHVISMRVFKDWISPAFSGAIMEDGRGVS